MIKNYKYRLYPTKKQIEKLEWTLDRCRELYNAALQERHDAWKMCKISISGYNQGKQLPEIKEIRPEYKDIYSQVLKNVLHRVDKAYQAFFRRTKSGKKPGYPRFQCKNRYDSFCYPQADRGNAKIENNKLYLSKIGHIKIKLHRKIQGRTKTCTIKREGQYWFVIFCCEIEQGIEKRTPYTDDAVGIDLGLYHFAALSSGDIIDNPRHYRKTEQKLVRIQQQIAKKKRGSRRRKKIVQQSSKAHRKVRNQRQDYLHKHSRWLVATYETIVFEDLTPAKMSKAPEPKQDENGKYLPNGASVKAGLNKSILDAGWSTFVTMCKYKAEEAGTVQVIKVDPYKTSQVCSGCLHEGPHKDLSERVHTCENCGLVLDRDVNAAVNIKNVWAGLNLRPAKRTKKKVQARTEPSEEPAPEKPLQQC